MCVRVCGWVCVCAGACVCVRVHVCACACVRACVRVHYVSVYIYVCVIIHNYPLRCNISHLYTIYRLLGDQTISEILRSQLICEAIQLTCYNTDRIIEFFVISLLSIFITVYHRIGQKFGKFGETTHFTNLFSTDFLNSQNFSFRQ